MKLADANPVASSVDQAKTFSITDGLGDEEPCRRRFEKYA
ncbi:MAG: hypothetical protein ACI82O_003403, partial [Patiriisocius sp.]